MGLPQSYVTDRLRYLDKVLKKYSIDQLENLRKDDIYLIGSYIQTYNFIELNIMRAFIILEDNGVISEKPKEGRGFPRFAKAIRENSKKISCGDNSEQNITENIDEILFRRSYRNILAHMAGKRMPNEDCFVFYSSEKKDYKEIHGECITSGNILYCIIDASDLRGLATHIQKYEKWAAHFVSEIYQRFNQL